MNLGHKLLALAALLGTALLGPAARGQYVAPQFRPNQASTLPTAQTQSYSAGVAGAPAGYLAPPPANYPGGYYTPYADPYGGFLNGVAAVTNAYAGTTKGSTGALNDGKPNGLQRLAGPGPTVRVKQPPRRR